MSFNRENYSRIRGEYAAKYKKAEDAADMRRTEVGYKIPEIAEIDVELAQTGMKILAVLTSEGNHGEELEKIRLNNEKLNAKYRELLRLSGYPENYTEPVFECDICRDTGFVDGKMCSCMRTELVFAGYESSGIANLLRTQTFDTFSLAYYRDNQATYDNMLAVLTVVREYAAKFKGQNSGNLAFFGGTGLGKTHLSSAVAKTVIERGFDVRYTTAISMLSDFEYQRFGNSIQPENDTTDGYFEAELLIIDDLGAEVTNQFSVSVLYNIINTRLNTGKPTVVSTNLMPEELRKRYTDRIASRIFGEYRALMFRGTDIRKQKIKNPL